MLDVGILAYDYGCVHVDGSHYLLERRYGLVSHRPKAVFCCLPWAGKIYGFPLQLSTLLCILRNRYDRVCSDYRV